jgi:predicted DNA-binding WGR domain protein
MWTMRSRTVLHSVDAAGNRFRFFVLEVWAPPVGTGAAVRKRWGRIGTEGRDEVLYFDDLPGAEHYAEVLLRRRRKRGYVEVTPSAWRLLALEAEAEARLRQIRHRLHRARETEQRPVAKSEQLVLELTG